MKNKRLRYGLVIGLTCTLATVASVAIAGASWGYQVGINDTYKYAVGSFAATRNSTDTLQYIGCYHNAYTSGASYANCYAVNAAGVGRTCYTVNTNMVEAIRSISDESYIYFQWNTDGTCSYVLIDKGSRFRP
jgi:hypothetical protein